MSLDLGTTEAERTPDDLAAGSDDSVREVTARRSRLTPERFATPPMTDRPGMRWWWQSRVPAETLVRELNSIAAAGFGEVELAFSPGFWADDAQRSALAAVLQEGRRLGIGVTMTLGAAWPLQTPNTATGTDHASQELQYGVRYIEPGEHGSLTLPAPFDDLEQARGGRLLSATIAEVLQQEEGPALVERAEVLGTRTAIVPPENSSVLRASSLEVVTDSVIDGRIEWRARPGRWALFAFWMRDSEQGVTSFIGRDAAVAATGYLDEHQLGETNRALLKESGVELFEDSLELNADSLFWSRDLVQRFVQRHGYDPTPLLPVFFAHGMCRYWVPNEEPTPDFELDTGAGGKIRQDYYRLLTDLYISDHLHVLQDWSASHGLNHKSQIAYGQNLEPVRSSRDFARHGGRVEGESLNSGDRAPVSAHHGLWRYALDWQRCIVGGAHQAGITRISTELGAQFQAAFALTLGDLKQMLDKEWASGITKPFVHGYASQPSDAPWPTQTRFWDIVSDSWNDAHFPEWANWVPLTDYWARGTAVLETGVARTDIAVYRDGFLTTAARGVLDVTDDFTAPAQLADTAAWEESGYTVQFIDPVGLAEAAQGARDGSLYPESASYRAIVVDARAMPPSAAEALLVAAEHGVQIIVIGDAPSADSGFADGEEGDARVVRAFSRLRRLDRAVFVAIAAEVSGALLDAGVLPRAATDGVPLLTQWREAESATYVIVYNPGSTDISTSISLDATGAVRELDLWTGASVPLAGERVADRTTLPLTMDALGLRMFEIAHTNATPEPSTRGVERWIEAGVGPWSIEVATEEPDGSRTVTVSDFGPGDWRSHGELESLSGVAVYRARVEVGSSSRFRVDLGDLAGSATVRVGDTGYGTVYTSGASVEIDSRLRDTAELTIEVRTVLRNAVIAGGTRPNVGSATQVQGLIGPVTLWGTG